MKICVVMGAGASLAQAERFRPRRDAQRKQPPLDTTFFQKVKALDISLTPALRSYIRTLTGEDPNLDALARYRMEEFFKDAYFDFRDRNDRRARAAYTDLVNLYTRVLRETTAWLCDDGHHRGPIGNLLGAAGAVADSLDVITFNHDLLIENEIYKRARLRGRWCLDGGYGAFGKDLGRLYFSEDAPEFNYHDDTICDHSRPIRILKLHGSLNWIVRIQGRQPTAKDLTGEGRFKSVFILPRRAPLSTPIARPGTGRGRKIWYTWPVIVPPIYAKQGLIARLRETWDDARDAITSAHRLVFYGYSLPQLDIDAEKLFQRGINANVDLPWVDVINPDPDAAARYSGISGKRPVRWYWGPDQFLAADRFRAA
jgi:hypothetical protein